MELMHSEAAKINTARIDELDHSQISSHTQNIRSPAGIRLTSESPGIADGELTAEHFFNKADIPTHSHFKINPYITTKLIKPQSSSPRKIVLKSNQSGMKQIQDVTETGSMISENEAH